MRRMSVINTTTQIRCQQCAADNPPQARYCLQCAAPLASIPPPSPSSESPFLRPAYEQDTASNAQNGTMPGASWLVLLCGIAGMIATYLPWVTVSLPGLANAGLGSASQSENGTLVGNDGWVIFAVSGVAVLLQVIAMLRGHDERALQGVGELILGAAALFVAIRDLSDLNSLTSGIGGISLSQIGINVSAGAGLWLAGSAGVGIGLGGLWRLAHK